MITRVAATLSKFLQNQYCRPGSPQWQRIRTVTFLKGGETIRVFRRVVHVSQAIGVCRRPRPVPIPDRISIGHSSQNAHRGGTQGMIEFVEHIHIARVQAVLGN